MHERRINDTNAYHVRTAMPHMDQRREYMADRRIKRLLPRVFYMPVDEWAQRIAWPWAKRRARGIKVSLGS